MGHEAGRRSWLKSGCLALAGLGFLAVLVLSGAALVAWRTTKGEQPRPERIERDLAAPQGPGASVTQARLELVVRAAQLLVLPAATGEPLRVDADYDPRNYALDVTSSLRAGTPVQRVVFGPRGPLLMAVLRIKLGATPPSVRVTLPAGTTLDLDVRLAATVGALELGGLAVSGLVGEVRGGAMKLSFLEPLATPMERLRLFGDTGSLEVTGLGNASPRETRIQQHLGELDLDLRGRWSRDGSVRLFVAVAGGRVWLPDGVRIERDGVPLTAPDPHDAEVPRPRLALDIGEHAGRVVVLGP